MTPTDKNGGSKIVGGGCPLGVVISGGGWHTPPLYANFMLALAEAGIKSYASLVPTLNVIHHDVTDNENPIFDMAEPAGGWPQAEDDAAVVEEDIRALIDQGRHVIVLAHSNGGFAGTQAAKAEYSAKQRAKDGRAGGVIGILYVSAFVLPLGVAVNEIIGEEYVPPYSKVHKYKKAGVSTPARMREFFFARVSSAESERYSKLLRAQPIPRSKLTNDAYAVYPLGFVVCQDDIAFPPDQQEAMCQARIDEGCDMTLYREPFDHSPHLHAIDRMVEIVQDFARVALGS